MKGYNKWSYSPYRPPLTEVGDIYICRVAPTEDSIHFEWLEAQDTILDKESHTGEMIRYEIYYRKRGKGTFISWGSTTQCGCDIQNLEEGTDYEFYVSAGEKKSRVRLARCGKKEGMVVNYLHPEDEAYAFSGRFLCSPSLVRHPNGYLLTSMDVYGANIPKISRSYTALTMRVLHGSMLVSSCLVSGESFLFTRASCVCFPALRNTAIC